MSNPFISLRQLLKGQATIIHSLEEIQKKMADQTQQNQANFADVQAAVNQIVNDNTQQNNAIAAQIKEVQTLVTDFAARSQAGNAPSPADFQQVVAQLQAVHSLVQQNTAAIQASGSSVAEADPNAAPAPTPAPVTDPATGVPNETPAGPATTDENTSSSLG